MSNAKARAWQPARWTFVPHFIPHFVAHFVAHFVGVALGRGRLPGKLYRELTTIGKRSDYDYDYDYD